VCQIPLKRKVKFVSLGKLRQWEVNTHGTARQAKRSLVR
jgi:hypothetical protein